MNVIFVKEEKENFTRSDDLAKRKSSLAAWVSAS
jgi:hypothetical protein